MAQASPLKWSRDGRSNKGTLFIVTNTKLVIKALNSMRSNSHWLVRKVHQLEIDVPTLGGWRPPGMWVTMREVGRKGEREGNAACMRGRCSHRL